MKGKKARKSGSTMSVTSSISSLSSSSSSHTSLPTDRPSLGARHTTHDTIQEEFISEKESYEEGAPPLLTSMGIPSTASTYSARTYLPNYRQSKEKYDRDIESQYSAGSEDNSPIEEVRAIVPGKQITHRKSFVVFCKMDLPLSTDQEKKNQ